MITAHRKYIQFAKESLLVALQASTVGVGMKWRFPNVSDEALEKAAIIALNIIAKDAVSPHECVVASDVLHFDNFPENKVSFGEKHV